MCHRSLLPTSQVLLSNRGCGLTVLTSSLRSSAHSTCVLKPYRADEVMLRLRFTGRARSIAWHLLTVTPLWGVSALAVYVPQASGPPNPETMMGVH